MDNLDFTYPNLPSSYPSMRHWINPFFLDLMDWIWVAGFCFSSCEKAAHTRKEEYIVPMGVTNQKGVVNIDIIDIVKL